MSNILKIFSIFVSVACNPSITYRIDTRVLLNFCPIAMQKLILEGMYIGVTYMNCHQTFKAGTVRIESP